MKYLFYTAACMSLALAATSCGGAKQQAEAPAEEPTTTELTIYNPDRTEAGTLAFATLPDSTIVLFDGSSLEGWRGYGRDTVTSKWSIEDSTLTFTPAETGEGGDIIFAHPFKNFEMTLDWKVSEGANSGIFYLAQESRSVNEKGDTVWDPIYISAPEYQVLDNANHPDAKLGKNNNRQSASLYDMIPAVPQNSKPFGEWNEAKIVVNNGTISHWQNGEKVVEYQINTPEWTALLQDSKFSEKAWPRAFELLNNCGGAEQKGYIGMQDHGNKVWFRNIRLKEL